MGEANIRIRQTVESLGILTGAGGADLVAAATVNAHTYIAITAIDDATISATSVDTDIWDSLSTIELPKGNTIYGKWSAVTVGSGDTAYVYRESSSD